MHSRASLTKGMKSEVAASSLPSRGPRRGRNCYVTPAFSGVPNKRDKFKNEYPTPAFSGARKRAEFLCSPCIPGGPQKSRQNQTWLSHPAFSGPKRGQNCCATPTLLGSITEVTGSQVPTSPLPSRGPKRGHNCCLTLAFSRVTNEGDRIGSGCLTPAFSGAKTGAELIPNPCNCGSPQQRGQNVATSPLPFRQKRAELLRNPCILGQPQQRLQNHNWLPHPCVLGGLKADKFAMLPLHSWGSPTKGMKSEVAMSPPTFSGAQKRA